MMNLKGFIVSTSQAASQNVEKDVGTISENENQASSEGEEDVEYDTDSIGAASQ